MNELVCVCVGGGGDHIFCLYVRLVRKKCLKLSSFSNRGGSGKTGP